MNRTLGLICLLITLFLFSFGWGERAFAEGLNNWEENRFIAHALGGIDGSRYTNSYEAFISNYHKGYRLFETDLMLTADGKLAATHDWSAKLQPDLHNEAGIPLSLSQFKSYPILGKYQPLSFIDIIHLMQLYPDFYLITDTKETDTEKIRQQFEYIVDQVKDVDPSLLQRIIPELYSPEMYETVMKIYPFTQKLYSLYQSNASTADIIEFVQDKKVSAIAMPISRIFTNPTLVYRLNQIGLKTYVHTVNNKLMMKILHRSGIYGFYTESEASPSNLLSNRTKTNEAYALQYSQMIGIFLLGYGISWVRNRRSKGTIKFEVK